MKTLKLTIIISIICFPIIQCSEEESIIRAITTNIPPTASSVNITGAPVVGEILKGNYIYSDKEGDKESGSQYKWYRADNETGLNKIEIPNATDTLYTVTDADVSKYLIFEVTPMQINNQKGKTVASNYIGKVNDDTTISSSIISIYQINNGIITDPFHYNVTGELYEAQKATNKHNEIWDLILKVVPSDYLSRISQFEIFWGSTDSRNAIGYVQANSDLTTWKLGMAIDYAYPNNVFNGDNEALYTALHEFAHILTLNETQVDEQASTNNCNFFPDYPKERFPRYGCSFTGSYINQFYNPFWKDLWVTAQNNGTINSSSWYFSETYPEQFISGYAGTTPSEDLAEVYIAYILNQTYTTKPIVQQKIDFFKALPEFEQIKTETREKLGSLASRVSSKSLSEFIKKSTTKGHRGCVKVH